MSCPFQQSVIPRPPKQGTAACTHRTQGWPGLLTGPHGAAPSSTGPCSVVSCWSASEPRAAWGVVVYLSSLRPEKNLCSYAVICLPCTFLCQAEEDHWGREGGSCYSLLSFAAHFCHYWHRRKVMTAHLVATDDCTTPWSGLNCLRNRGCQSPGEPGPRNGYGPPGPVPRTTEPAG